uniref:Uncharacterized protein n=1 Tax=viral metagenome TaxID=1070528 RepID=A0A6C0EBK6_9ZZZZ
MAESIGDIDNYIINLRTIDNKTFELTATCGDKIFIKIVTEDDIKKISSLCEISPFLIKKTLEEHLHSDKKHSAFFRFTYAPNKITLTYDIDMNHVSQPITFDLTEYTLHTIDKKLTDLKIELKKDILEYHILSSCDYDDKDNEFVYNCDLGSARKKHINKFKNLIKNYYVKNTVVYRDIHDNSGLRNSICEIQPLVCEISKHCLHIHGWMVEGDDFFLVERKEGYKVWLQLPFKFKRNIISNDNKYFINRDGVLTSNIITDCDSILKDKEIILKNDIINPVKGTYVIIDTTFTLSEKPMPKA